MDTSTRWHQQHQGVGHSDGMLLVWRTRCSWLSTTTTTTVHHPRRAAAYTPCQNMEPVLRYASERCSTTVKRRVPPCMHACCAHTLRLRACPALDTVAHHTYASTHQVRNVVKRFTTRQGVYMAVNNIDLSIEANKITALLGPSGSGKTTLLRMVAGLELPTSGQVLLDGEDVTTASIKSRNIGMVFQNYALFRHMSVADNIAFGPRIRRLPIDIDARCCWASLSPSRTQR